MIAALFDFWQFEAVVIVLGGNSVNIFVNKVLIDTNHFGIRAEGIPLSWLRPHEIVVELHVLPSDFLRDVVHLLLEVHVNVLRLLSFYSRLIGSILARAWLCLVHGVEVCNVICWVHLNGWWHRHIHSVDAIETLNRVL